MRTQQLVRACSATDNRPVLASILRPTTSASSTAGKDQLMVDRRGNAAIESDEDGSETGADIQSVGSQDSVASSDYSMSRQGIFVSRRAERRADSTGSMALSFGTCHPSNRHLADRTNLPRASDAAVGPGTKQAVATEDLRREAQIYRIGYIQVRPPHAAGLVTAHMLSRPFSHPFCSSSLFCRSDYHGTTAFCAAILEKILRRMIPSDLTTARSYFVCVQLLKKNLRQSEQLRQKDREIYHLGEEHQVRPQPAAGP